MIVSLIWAMTDEHVIGIDNKLPWHLPADMKWFRQHTLGKPIIVGRKTFDSFGGKPLPQRKNIIVTRDLTYTPENTTIASSLPEALSAAGNVDEVMVIGGASLYAQALPLAQRLYITNVHANIKGDAYFPEVNLENWKEMECIKTSKDEKNAFACTFYIYEKSD